MLLARAHVRQRVSLPAKVLAPDLSVCADGVVKDVSAGGALIYLPDGSPIPERVYLWREDGEPSIECQVRWRKINLVGLCFVAPESAGVRAFVKACKPAKRLAMSPRLRKSA